MIRGRSDGRFVVWKLWDERNKGTGGSDIHVSGMCGEVMADSDEDILGRYARTRDASAFGELVARHKDMVYAACRRVLGNQADAEDAAQECFLALMQHPERAQGSPAGWLHRVAVRCAIDVARRETARKAREAKAMRQEATLDGAPRWEDVSGQVDRAVDELPDDLRVAVIRYYLEGRRQEEIAAELGVTQGTVSKRVERGTEELRLRMAKAGVTVSAAALVSLLSTHAVEAAPATLSSALGHMTAAGTNAAGAGATAGGGIGFVKGAAIFLVLAGVMGVTVAVYPVQGDAPPPPPQAPSAPPTAATPTAPPATKPPPPPATVAKLPTPEEAVVLDPKMTWNRTGWWHDSWTSFVWEQEAPSARVFVVGEPNKGYVWTYHLAAPIPQPEYGTLVMKYRARNTSSTSGQYTLWLDDTRGPDSGGVRPFRSRDLIADGEAHEARCDLATLKPAGPVVSLALGVTCGPTAPATFELIGLRFERANPGQAQPLGEDAPVRVTVRDLAGQPIEDATVTVDAERLNFARSAQTDGDGAAGIVAVRTTNGGHMVRVSKAGWVTVEGECKTGTTPTALAVTLCPAVAYAAKVVDETGAPVEGAVVALANEEYPNPRDVFRTQRALNVTTDSKGVWRSGLMDATLDGLRLRFAHPDFYNGQESQTAAAELRTGETVTVLRHGVTVSGIVRSSEGRPVNKAMVVIVQPGVRANARPMARTDADGKFTVRQARPGEFTMVVSADGNCPELVKGAATPGMEPVEVAMGIPKTVRFRVVDPEGQPVLNAKVWVESWRGNDALDWHRPTDKDGRVAWTNAPPDEVSYEVVSRTHGSVRGVKFAARDEEYVIALKPRVVR